MDLTAVPAVTEIEPYSSTVGPRSNSNNSHGVVAEEGMAFFEKRSRGFHRKIFGFFADHGDGGLEVILLFAFATAVTGLGLRFFKAEG